jgi:hypothetical protein
VDKLDDEEKIWWRSLVVLERLNDQDELASLAETQYLEYEQLRLEHWMLQMEYGQMRTWTFPFGS